MANPYQILRILPDASPEQVEEAYHRMRKLVAYGGAGGVTEQAVNVAYSVLSDPHRRAQVDVAMERRRGGRAPRAESQAAGSPAEDNRLFARLRRLIS